MNLENIQLGYMIFFRLLTVFMSTIWDGLVDGFQAFKVDGFFSTKSL